MLSTCPNAANQYCYFKEVSDTVVSDLYENPIANGGALVWTDTLTLSATNWVEITLTNRFFNAWETFNGLLGKL